jgi:hypothetical protein
MQRKKSSPKPNVTQFREAIVAKKLAAPANVPSVRHERIQRRLPGLHALGDCSTPLACAVSSLREAPILPIETTGMRYRH